MPKLGNLLLKQEDLSTIIKLYEEEKTLKNTAQKLNVNLETLRQYFIKYEYNYTKQKVYQCDHDFFSKDTEFSFYWAGFLAADGNVEKAKPRIKLALKQTDKNHIENFKNTLKTDSPIVDTTTEDNRPGFKSKIYYGSYVRITSEKICKDLKYKFGITPKKSLTYVIPEEILNHPLANHFIRGLWDGDGWIFPNDTGNSGVIGICGNQFVVSQIQQHINIKFNFEKEDGGLQFNKNVYKIYYRQLSKIKQILNYLYKDTNIYLDRKHKNAQILLNGQEKKIILIPEEIIKKYKEFDGHIGKIAQYFEVSEITIIRRNKEFNLNLSFNHNNKLT